jgi:hypothetical protein
LSPLGDIALAPAGGCVHGVAAHVETASDTGARIERLPDEAPLLNKPDNLGFDGQGHLLIPS